MTTKKQKAINKALFEPVAPYFSDTYMTLMSVVQGFALGELFLIIQKMFFQDGPLKIPTHWFFIILMLINCFLIICLLWHRYSVHDQYYAWSIGTTDVLIPFGFSILEGILVLLVQGSIWIFISFIGFMNLLGALAYYHIRKRQTGPNAKAAFTEHFSNEISDGIGDTLFVAMRKFEKRTLNQYLVFGFIYLAMGLILKITPLEYSNKFCMFALMHVAIYVSLQFHYDLHLEFDRVIRGEFVELKDKMKFKFSVFE